MEIREIFVRHRDEDINLDDIPEITDFSKAIKNPFAERFKDGYIMIEEREDHNYVTEIRRWKAPKDQCISTI